MKNLSFALIFAGTLTFAGLNAQDTPKKSTSSTQTPSDSTKAKAKSATPADTTKATKPKK